MAAACYKQHYLSKGILRLLLGLEDLHLPYIIEIDDYDWLESRLIMDSS
jgi:hypothetical protein